MRELYVEVDLDEIRRETDPSQKVRDKFFQYVEAHGHDRIGCWLLSWDAYFEGAISYEEREWFSPFRGRL